MAQTKFARIAWPSWSLGMALGMSMNTILYRNHPSHAAFFLVLAVINWAAFIGFIRANRMYARTDAILKKAR